MQWILLSECRSEEVMFLLTLSVFKIVGNIQIPALHYVELYFDF